MNPRLKIYWPVPLSDRSIECEKGFIVGWKVNEHILTVATLVESDSVLSFW